MAPAPIETWNRALGAAGSRFVRLGATVRTHPRPQMSGDRPGPGFDPVVIHYAKGGKLRWSAGGKAAVWYAPPAHLEPGGGLHPTQKSLRLIRDLVRDFTREGELVLDPFAGSGTTAIACAELQRNFIGYERDPIYHASAITRISMAGAGFTFSQTSAGQ